MIHVVATLELAPGTREAYLPAFRKLVADVRADVRAEKRCSGYGPAIDSQTDLANPAKVGPGKIVVMEK